jgi:AcrR family transcriptional regulator
MPAAKGDTRQLIIDTALRLFEERGYAATTMRAVALEAGLSPSNAYYWFASKDELVQAFYLRIQEQHRVRAAEVLTTGGRLVDRLRAVEHAYLDVVAPHHRFGAAFLTTAIRSDSPSNPLSAASSEAREESLAIYREVVAGARPALTPRLRGVLPELLWLCHLGLTLFWVSDSSADQERTRRLVDTAAPLVTGMARLGRLPIAASVVDQLGRVLGVVLDRPAAPVPS